MIRLTESDSQGNWRVKGIPWKELYLNQVMTVKNKEILYGALSKLRDYEETGLDPEEVERLCRSDLMQKEFTKSDLKDGMVLHAEDGAKTTLVSDFYTTKEDLKIADGRIFGKVSGLEVIKIEYGGQVIWENPTKLMTVDEMKAKLEELTGEKIEVEYEADRFEMIGELYCYCDSINGYCRGCELKSVHEKYGCNFENHPEETLKQCYEKVMEDGK